MYRKIKAKRMSPDYLYLSKSHSLADVEYRQRQLQNGLAPHQRMATSNMRNYI